MKRDMDLVRDILFAVEAWTDDGPVDLKFEGRSGREVMYHAQIMFEAGLLDTLDTSSAEGKECLVLGLTWEGHEFLDAARENSRWETAKRTVMEKAGSLNFEAIKSVLLQLVTQAMA